MKYTILYFLLISCSKVTPVVSDGDRSAIKLKIFELENSAKTDSNGWIVSESCDAMLWTGKACLEKTDLLAAEDNGKFYRTPDKRCFEDQRSGSSWSRDMSLGLLHCLIQKKDLAAIERHIDYGNKHHWIMGDGLKSRTAYSPALIGLWYKAARKLGHNYRYAEISNVYPKGLVDYQAHLQMLDIYLRGKLNGKISNIMLRRIIEHANRLPDSIFYHLLRLKYDSSHDFDLSVCLDDNHSVRDYVRCDGEHCELAERIFSCKMALEQ